MKVTAPNWQEPLGPEYVDEPEFMAELGRSLAEWGNVEHALSSIFAVSLQVPQPQHARAAFHSVISFRDRLGLVDATIQLVTTAFPGPEWAILNNEWGRIADASRRASRHRNELAHMHVWHSPKIGTFGWKDITKIGELPFDPKERRKVVVTADRMRDYRKSFSSVQKRLGVFERDLKEAMKSPLTLVFG